MTAITGASQHFTRVKVNIGTEIFAKTMMLFSREAGIAAEMTVLDQPQQTLFPLNSSTRFTFFSVCHEIVK